MQDSDNTRTHELKEEITFTILASDKMKSGQLKCVYWNTTSTSSVYRNPNVLYCLVSAVIKDVFLYNNSVLVIIYIYILGGFDMFH